MGMEMRMRNVVAALVFGTLVSGASAGEIPARELAGERYEVVTDPAKLPPAVQSAWAAEIGQKELHVAAAGGPFNATDVILDETTPGHRLILSAVSPKYAVVYFETGGVAHFWRVLVFSRAAQRATLVWQGSPAKTYTEPEPFLAAIRSGDLWRRPGSRAR